MTINPTREALVLNQFRAAKKVFESMRDFFEAGGGSVSGLSFFRESLDESHIVRSICLPTVASTAVNFVFNSKIIGDETGEITVGDFYKVMLPLHRIEPTKMPASYDMGWRVVDDFGNTYHHAVAAFLKIFDLKTYSLREFSGIGELLSAISGREAFLSLSLDNRFSLEKTIDEEGLKYLARIYPGFGSQKGRHAVFVSGFTGNRVFIADPFQILKKGESPKIKEFDYSEIDWYFSHQAASVRALAFSKEEIDFPEANINKIYIPDYVEKEIALFRNKFHFTKTA